MPFAAEIELSALDGTNGFRISGVAMSDYSGWSVASAGDVNGDGIDDLIIDASNASPNGVNDAGAIYVVFGGASPFGSNLNLSDLDGTNGFRISGEAANDRIGRSVASAGDINGDGVDDLIIGARYASPNGGYSGASYVVFGSSAGFSANLNLADLNGANGFEIRGEAADDRSGYSVASAGDVNGDGFDDLIVGALRGDPIGYSNAGVSYVVFGAAAAFQADLELSTLDGTNGFRINGVAANDLSGVSVASAGDVNGDDVDDLIVGAWLADPNGSTNAGAGYVVFGSEAGFGADLDLIALNGSNGFRISGVADSDHSGVSVASAGDINGDGIDDLIIGARLADPNSVGEAGASYVVFGSGSPFGSNLNLSDLDGTNGFRISGVAVNDRSGGSVASAGDVNGDGFDDLIIGARYADPNGVLGAGASYVVFGRDSGFGADLDLSALDGADGFRINGIANSDFSGWSVASAGDINSDGIDDLIIGAVGADPHGNDSGASYVIFGQPSGFVGNASDQTYSGAGGVDSLSGLGGKDILNGLGGDDIIDGGADNDVLSGGDGLDDLLGGAGNDWLQGDAGDDDLNGGDGADKLFGGMGSDALLGGLGNDRFDGGSEIDTLTGNEGNDYLDGGTGADVMTGGLANDVYIVDDAGDQTIELAGEGYDIVRTALDAWLLGDNLEALELQGAADIDGTGNGAANNLQGNSGANTLSGLAGVDTINGNDGDDIIVGGAGNDLLRGGTGADQFLVAHAFGATLETDQIYDFSDAEGDILDLSGAYGGTLSLVRAFTRAAGEMTVTFAGGVTTVRLDTTGDGKVDYQVKINGDVTGDTAGWVL